MNVQIGRVGDLTLVGVLPPPGRPLADDVSVDPTQLKPPYKCTKKRKVPYPFRNDPWDTPMQRRRVEREEDTIVDLVEADAQAESSKRGR